jgi:hypothetical protein
MPKLIPVEDRNDLGRDPHSKAIINTNIDGVYKARMRKEALNKKKEEERKTQERLANLEGTVTELTDLVKQVLKKLS